MKIKLSEFKLTKLQRANIDRLRKKTEEIYDKLAQLNDKNDLSEEKRNGYVGAAISCEFKIIKILNQNNKHMLRNLVINNILFEE